MLSLGQELKRAREERGVTLHEIANATHIGVRFLQAIENDSYDVLPGGVFNRAFVRKFAKQVGFDEQQAMKLYEEQLEEMGGEPQRRYYTGLDDLDARPTSGNGLLFSFLALILLTAGAYLAYEYFKTPAPPAENNLNQPLDSSTPTPTPNGSPEPGLSPLPGASPTTTPPLNSSAGAMRLLMIAGNDQCWVQVAADTAEPEEATLQPGDVREFNANEKFVLNIGNYPALKITINGRQLNVTKFLPNQKSVVAKNVVITKDNYQQFVD
jgi:cytoskeletal protein RodZ